MAHLDPQRECKEGGPTLLEPPPTQCVLDRVEYEAIFRHSLDGILFSSPNGGILAANPAACSILGRTEAEICQLGRSGLLVPDDPVTLQALRQRMQHGHVRAEIPMRRADGSLFVADVSSTTFSTAQGELRACVIFRDVSEQVALRERLRERSEQLDLLARRDPLTGLLNLRGFQQAAEQTLSFADRQELPVQIVFLDLDNFKAINDQLGHRIGDEVLRRFATAVSTTVRAVDETARLGGDEFAILVLGASTRDAELVLERISAALESSPSDGPPISFSSGIVERVPASPVSLDQLLALADDKMYEQKGRRPSDKPRADTPSRPARDRDPT